MRPLRYGDSIQVKTWVADFRRVRSRRMYEMRLAGTGELVARANTDWVYLDTVTGRPATIPPEMIAVFIPEGAAEPAPPRERVPSLLPPPDAWKTRRRVTWRDIDGAQHVNNCQLSGVCRGLRAMDALAARGWPLEHMVAEGMALSGAATSDRVFAAGPAGRRIGIGDVGVQCDGGFVHAPHDDHALE